ncbi:MAG TPA: hypothetical protein VMF58_01205 [Rhizomicrobium sp.]|nr:hypothetical protein [Rhizomicrobium sp.]
MKAALITPQTVDWLEFIFIWTFLAYGIVTDRRYDDRSQSGALTWQFALGCRAIAIAMLAFWFCGSWVLGLFSSLAMIAQAQIRYRTSKFQLANECIPPLAVFLSSLALVDAFSISPQHQFRFDIDPAHLASLLVGGTALCLALRWGAFFVKAILKLALPAGSTMDPNEIRRGFLIGVLERMLLTIVVALGSFSALGFLVAAKSLVRSHQFEGPASRDFTEYFLIGTLTSTLVAVCAGLAIRATLHLLWPELLLLDMKSD